jgi:hypothetical protein
LFSCSGKKIVKDLALFASCLKNIQNSGIRPTQFKQANPRNTPVKSFLAVVFSEIFKEIKS